MQALRRVDARCFIHPKMLALDAAHALHGVQHRAQLRQPGRQPAVLGGRVIAPGRGGSGARAALRVRAGLLDMINFGKKESAGASTATMPGGSEEEFGTFGKSVRCSLLLPPAHTRLGHVLLRAHVVPLCGLCAAQSAELTFSPLSRCAQPGRSRPAGGCVFCGPVQAGLCLCWCARRRACKR